MSGPQEQVFDKIGSPAVLRYRVGAIFPADGEQPDNAEGTISHNSPEGAKVNKFYLPPQRIDLAQVVRAVYPVPEGVRNAPYAELVLNDRHGCSTRFGRFGEERSFGFSRERRLIYLRVYRKEENPFSPLYIETVRGEYIFCMRLDVEWSGNTIAVTLTEEVKEDEFPPCLNG